MCIIIIVIVHLDKKIMLASCYLHMPVYVCICTTYHDHGYIRPIYIEIETLETNINTCTSYFIMLLAHHYYYNITLLKCNLIIYVFPTYKVFPSILRMNVFSRTFSMLESEKFNTCSLQPL